MKANLTVYFNFNKYSNYDYYISFNEIDIQLPKDCYRPLFEKYQQFISVDFEFAEKVDINKLISIYIDELMKIESFKVYQATCDGIRLYKSNTSANLLIKCNFNIKKLFWLLFIQLFNVQSGRIVAFEQEDKEIGKSIYKFKSLEDFEYWINDAFNDYDFGNRKGQSEETVIESIRNIKPVSLNF